MDAEMAVKYQLAGLNVYPSRNYHNRWECYFWGSRGKLIKYWIRTSFGETDDLVWASNDQIGVAYESLITSEQLTLTLLRWQ